MVDGVSKTAGEEVHEAIERVGGTLAKFYVAVRTDDDGIKELAAELRSHVEIYGSVNYRAGFAHGKAEGANRT